LNKLWKKEWDFVLTQSVDFTKEVNQIHAALGGMEIETFLDIGVGNIGSEAWQIKKQYPDCQIIGFEPQIERFALLSCLPIATEYPGRLIPTAVGSREGSVPGYMGHLKGRSDFKVYTDEHKGYIQQNIWVHTLDQIERNLGTEFNNCFIWADVEGAELEVLKGAKRLFNENKVIGVLVELRNKPLAVGACSAKEVDTFLIDKGFKSTEPLDSLKDGHKDFIYVKNL